MNQKGMKKICYNSIVHVKSGVYPSENANWAAPRILSAEMYCLMAACIATNGQSPSGSHCFCHHITPLQNVGVCGGAGAVPSIHSPAAFMQESVLALCTAWWWCPMIAMFANALEKTGEKTELQHDLAFKQIDFRLSAVHPLFQTPKTHTLEIWHCLKIYYPCIHWFIILFPIWIAYLILRHTHKSSCIYQIVG